MLDALACLLCLKLCWHNQRKPTDVQKPGAITHFVFQEIPILNIQDTSTVTT